MKVVFAKGLVSTLSEKMRAFGELETGGCLVGTIDGNRWTILAASDPPPDSIHEPAAFERGIAGLEEWLESQFALGRDYLGEWHTHPHELSSPEPSFADLDTHVAAAKRFDRALLLVILAVSPDNPQITATIVEPDGGLLR